MFKPAVNLLILLAAVGCGKPPAPAPAAAAAPPAAKPAQNPAGFGTFSGKVTITGWNPPPAAPIMVKCGNGQMAIPNEKVIIKNNGLENVVIYLKNAPPSTLPESLAPALLDQKMCVYIPHVLAMRTGQSLMVTNSEPLLHNIHMFPQFNAPVNFGMNNLGSHTLVFTKPEIMRVKCDVHPWMNAWIAAFDHPWFAVTSNGGKFAISHVPAGPQTFVAWHEQFGEIEQTVTITTDQTPEITFTFKPPNAAQ